MAQSRNLVPQVRERLSVIDCSTVDGVNQLQPNGNVNAMNGGRINDNSEIRLAKVSLIIVFMFIICHSVRWVPNIYELLWRMNKEKFVWNAWVESVTNISHFSVTLNSSVNFFIYCFTHYRVLNQTIGDVINRNRRSTLGTQDTRNTEPFDLPLLPTTASD